MAELCLIRRKASYFFFRSVAKNLYTVFFLKLYWWKKPSQVKWRVIFSLLCLWQFKYILLVCSHYIKTLFTLHCTPNHCHDKTKEKKEKKMLFFCYTMYMWPDFGLWIYTFTGVCIHNSGVYICACVSLWKRVYLYCAGCSEVCSNYYWSLCVLCILKTDKKCALAKIYYIRIRILLTSIPVHIVSVLNSYVVVSSSSCMKAISQYLQWCSTVARIKLWDMIASCSEKREGKRDPRKKYSIYTTSSTTTSSTRFI